MNRKRNPYEAYYKYKLNLKEEAKLLKQKLKGVVVHSSNLLGTFRKRQ